MMERTTSASWLTPRRLRAHGVIVGIVLWSVYLWTVAAPGLRDRYGNLKGTDFLHFYTLGLVAQQHQGTALYDMKAQSELAVRHVPEARGIYYLPLYPPQTSIPFVLLAGLTYARALAVWWTLSAVIYLLCCFWIWRTCPNVRPHALTVAILALAFPGFFHLIAWGQTSAIALACFTAAYACLRKDRRFLAGLALGCLAFKPQLAVAAAIVFLAAREGKMLFGAGLSALTQFLAGILYYGTQAFRDWLWMIRVVSGNLRAGLTFLEPKMYQTHSLRSFWSMLVPWPRVAFLLFLATAAVILLITVLLWTRRSIPLSVRFSALLFATVLVAPHLTVYDLVILAPALLLLSDELIGARGEMSDMLGITLYCVYLLPLLGPLARWTHVQLTVIAMTAVLFLLWREVAKNSVERASAA